MTGIRKVTRIFQRAFASIDGFQRVPCGIYYFWAAVELEVSVGDVVCTSSTEEDHGG